MQVVSVKARQEAALPALQVETENDRLFSIVAESVKPESMKRIVAC